MHKERSILHALQQKLTGLVTYCVRSAFRNTFRETEWNRRRWRRRKEFFGATEKKYLNSKDNTFYRTLWRNRFGRGFGLVA